MVTAWDGWYARHDGLEWPATVQLVGDDTRVRLRADGPTEGFDEVVPGRFVRVVAASDCAAVEYRWTVCVWRDQPFRVVSGGADGLLRLEYTGGSAPAARRLGLEGLERGVYRVSVPRDDVHDLRTETVPLR